MEIIPQGPESIQLNSFIQDMDSSGSSFNQESNDKEVDIGLALHVEPINFLPIEIGWEELMEDASQEAQHDGQMALLPTPQADHQDVSVVLPQVSHTDQQEAQNVSVVLPQVSQEDHQDVNGSMLQSNADAVIPSTDQGTWYMCAAASSQQDAQVSQTDQQDAQNVNVVLPQVSQVDQQDANARFSSR
jgi:hypothetical protein